MFELFLFLLLIFFIDFLFKKPKHKRNKNFVPRLISKRFSRNPNNRKKGQSFDMLLLGEDVPKEKAERVRTLVQDILGKANQADMDSHNSPP